MIVPYIVSSPYSGSTLLSFLLNAHPDIGTISEFDVMDVIQSNPDYLCSCGAKIRECVFFNRLAAEMKLEGLPFEIDNMDLMFDYSKNERLNRYLMRKFPLIDSSFIEKNRDKLVKRIPSVDNFIQRMKLRNSVFMEKLVKLQNAKVFLDANKDPYRMKILSENHNVVPIYLYKNGIAGVYSLVNAAKKINRTVSVKDATKRWFKEQITILRILEDLNNRNTIVLSYSDLCNETKVKLEDICRHIGLPSYDFSNYSNVEHHIVGNAMRVGNIENIHERKDWVEGFSTIEKKQYLDVAKKYINKIRKYNEVVADNIWI